MKKLLLLSAAVVLVLAGAVSAQTAADLIKAGDEAYDQRNDAKALESYLAAVEAEPGNYEALWKASRSLVDNGDLVDTKIKGAEDKQKKLFQDAADYARKAVEANPNDTNGHFQLSASLGKYALMLGKKDQIAMSHEIKAEIEKAIELDAANDGAYHALSRWHRKIAEIGGAKRALGSILYGKIPKGSYEEAETYMKKAIEIKPEYINHRLELARLFVEIKKYPEAAEEFQKCLDLPETTSKDAMYKEEAKNELAAIQKKLK
ncbi:MAG: tetratricopeptide repeat protein [Candidatus Aminicenantes bacterium]|nr:tetratricopeptide repeat protein [Candidatus Aminicenantes bacterium]